MPSRSSPSSRSHLVQVPGVIEAGGVLREMLGSLRNLDQLVRSLRVGPRGLERAIHDVSSACPPSAEAARSLTDLLRGALPPDPALEELGQFVQERMAETATALDQASQKPMTARNRLALEQVLARVLPDLEGGRDLLELLTEAAWAPTVVSPLIDLLSIGHVPEPSAGHTVQVTLDESFDRYDIDLPPSMAHTCLNILASAFQARHGSGPALRLRPEGDTHCLEFTSSSPATRTSSWPLLPLVEPSLRVTATALVARGCQVSWGDQPRIVLSRSILWERPPES